MKQPDTVDARVYLLVDPLWSASGKADDDSPLLGGAKVVKATQGRPARSRAGVVVRITLRLPASAFLPLQPTALVVVPPDAAETITVVVDHPDEAAPAVAAGPGDG